MSDNKREVWIMEDAATGLPLMLTTTAKAVPDSSAGMRLAASRSTATTSSPTGAPCRPPRRARSSRD